MTPVAFVLRADHESHHPRVTVVVSTRNHGGMLEELINGVWAQDLSDEAELIVCDNASTDHTEALMRGAVDDARWPLTYIRLREDIGAAAGRNVGISFAAGEFIAFTDSDCVPSPGWLRTALAGFSSNKIGIVQGRTVPIRTTFVPLFEHHIETTRLDGHFSTSNIVYRRIALAGLRFDPGCWYWEDTDLAWRVLESGWQATFVDAALVAHQIIPLSGVRWILWPRHFSNWPAKAARYPAFRQHLFLGVWVRPLHLFFDLAVLGVALARWRPAALAATLPYALTFGTVRGVGGRFPAAKVAAGVGWDLVAFVSLVAGSIRHRALVL